MRYQCDIPGFEDNFFDLSERWTRGEVKAFFAETGEPYLALIRAKLTAIHLAAEPPTGAITTPEQLTSAATDDIDLAVWKWFSTAINRGVDDLYRLGEAHASRWLSAQGTTTTRDGSPKPS